MIGAGFWARYQLAAWGELPEARCVAICDRDRPRAEKLALDFGVDAVWDDPLKMLSGGKFDFVDIITTPETHAALAELALRHGVPAICQKPMTPAIQDARRLVAKFHAANVPLLVHENWRWQAPIRAFREVLHSGRLGKIVRGRIDYAHSYPVFDHQPNLRKLEQFILTDMGAHILDVARFLYGEARTLYCQTRRIHPHIQGEDVATVMLRMADDVTLTANMSYASRWEFDRFPETFIQAEGSEGGVSLGADCALKIFTRDGVEQRRVAPPHYAWANPDYALVHASIVECNRNLLSALRGEGTPETNAGDNIKTLELVFAAYDSAASGKVVQF